MQKKLWFRAKRYGWGWYPISWEGWLTLLIWVILFTFGIIKMDHEWLKNVIFIIIFTAILIYICYKKGEKPGWRWGGKKINDTK
jgi:uncharacterized membrane protein YhaH (DUF805 family)